MIGYYGAYCGEYSMYRGRIYSIVAQKFLEIIKAAGYPDWLPKFVKLAYS